MSETGESDLGEVRKFFEKSPRNKQIRLICIDILRYAKILLDDLPGNELGKRRAPLELEKDKERLMSEFHIETKAYDPMRDKENIGDELHYPALLAGEALLHFCDPEHPIVSAATDLTLKKNKGKMVLSVLQRKTWEHLAESFGVTKEELGSEEAGNRK